MGIQMEGCRAPRENLPNVKLCKRRLNTYYPRWAAVDWSSLVPLTPSHVMVDEWYSEKHYFMFLLSYSHENNYLEALGRFVKLLRASPDTQKALDHPMKHNAMSSLRLKYLLRHVQHGCNLIEFLGDKPGSTQ
jgi:hypothetical protein